MQRCAEVVTSSGVAQPDALAAAVEPFWGLLAEARCKQPMENTFEQLGSWGLLRFGDSMAERWALPCPDYKKVVPND